MSKNRISASITLGSINPFGKRITTWVLTYPRIIHSEFMTHRMFSRNSASSRAIPFETLLKRVEEAPFIPIKWMKEHKGMQGFDYHDEITADMLKLNWLEARDEAVDYAKTLDALGLSKQFVNRLLEPFMWHTVIMTTTEIENFFALRAHDMAEIHIQDLAYKMLEEYNKYEFQELKGGEWHIPFKEVIDEGDLHYYIKSIYSSGEYMELWDSIRVKVSAGICAGVSYGRIKDKIDITDMLDLHDSLVVRPYSGKRGTRTITDPVHASPTEHQARAMSQDEYEQFTLAIPRGFPEKPEKYFTKQVIKGVSRNFIGGWLQYRSLLPNENAKDRRVIQ